MRIIIFSQRAVFSIALLLLFIPSSLARQLPVQAFSRMPAWGSVVLSTNGSYIAAEEQSQGAYVLSIFRLSGAQLKRTFQLDLDKSSIRWMTWLSDTRLMVSIGFADHRYSSLTLETRLVAMNFDGGESKNIFKRVRNLFANELYNKLRATNIQDNVIDKLVNDPDHILMSFDKGKVNPMEFRPKIRTSIQAYRVNVRTAKRSLVQDEIKGVSDWMTDQRGEVRIGFGQKDDAWQIWVREADGKKWRALYRKTPTSLSVFDIYGFAVDPSILYVGSNHEGGTTGLYEYDLRTDQFVRKIFKHPEVDIASVTWDVSGRRIIRVHYILDGYQSVWLDSIKEQEFNSLRAVFPEKNINIVSRTQDEKKIILHKDSPTDGGEYYLYDKSIGEMVSFGPNYPELASAALGATHPFNYRARDGLEIPAFLSLPAGITDPQDAARLPLVVLPHGGPTSRDYLDFDPFIHLLTNRGYAVLQMNFRGSWGYGAAFQAAGNREWGRKMQDDITDGVKYLIAQGIADPARVCIFGVSYGGYAAMMGAVKTPDLYQCAVSLNAVFDLRKFIRHQWQFIGGRSGLGTAHIGNYSERDFLDEVSPSKRAGEIKIPVLVVSAKDDRTVPYNQSKTMVSALKRAGVDHQYIELETGGHGLNNAQSRTAFMTALDTFLAQHLH